ncbi:MAG: hypothetical protein R3C11_21210 [Planctomycetaceae bacterium]
MTEQMDLYLSVREFLQIWEKKNRLKIESRMTPQFAGILHELPDEYFSYLHEKVGDVKSSLDRFRPQATLNEDTAVVRLNRKSGRIDIGMKLVNEQWMVNEIAAESSRNEDHLTSMVKSADALRSVAIFLKGYGEGDKNLIENVTEKNFFTNAIVPGQLTDVSLPGTSSLTKESQMVIRGNRIDVDIPFNEQVASITLREINREEGKWKQPGFHITDVSLQQMGGMKVSENFLRY